MMKLVHTESFNPYTEVKFFLIQIGNSRFDRSLNSDSGVFCIMDEEQLKKYLEICQNSASTPLSRAKALTQLFTHIQNSPDLYRSSHQDYPEALNRTFRWASKNIGSFTPSSSISTSLITWVNSYLYWRIRDLHTPDSQRPLSLDAPIGHEENPVTLGEIISSSDKLDLLEEKIKQEQEAEIQNVGQQIKEYLQQDSAGFLRVCHPRNHPECHCQELVQRLLLKEPPETIRAVAKSSNINEQTLYTHWREKCEPRLRIIALRFDRELIEALSYLDVQNYLRECHFWNQPDCNCFELVKRLVLADSIEDVSSIAHEFNMNRSEVWKHWENQCLPLLKQYRCNLDA